MYRDQVAGAVAVATPDALQVVSEDEADAIEALAGEGVLDVFPYGFVVRNPKDPFSRTLRANPDEDQFDGIVTFAYKVPPQDDPADDPFTISILFLAVDDDEVKVTQSVEEQTPAAAAAFEARAEVLGADVRTILPPAGLVVASDPGKVRLLCDVRVAGTAESPLAGLGNGSGTEPWLTIPSLEVGFQSLPRTVRLGAASCAGGLGAADSTTFVVYGHQSGRNFAGTYVGSNSLVFAPTGPGGSFFPGEEVEVTLTTALGGTKPVVARYRMATANAPARFEVIGDTLELTSEPGGVALGDLDGDGDLDLATANDMSGTVSLLFNRGMGRSTTPRTTPSPLPVVRVLSRPATSTGTVTWTWSRGTRARATLRSWSTGRMERSTCASILRVPRIGASRWATWKAPEMAIWIWWY